jgi:hypothetical protein
MKEGYHLMTDQLSNGCDSGGAKIEPVKAAGNLGECRAFSAEAIQAADDAACKLDYMFRDIFSWEERTDLITVILRAATGAAP